MRNYYLLAIPAIIGIFVGAYLGIVENDKVENNETLLTAQKLVRNGSPIVGNPNAPITILEWGDFQCTLYENGVFHWNSFVGRLFCWNNSWCCKLGNS